MPDNRHWNSALAILRVNQLIEIEADRYRAAPGYFTAREAARREIDA